MQCLPFAKTVTLLKQLERNVFYGDQMEIRLELESDIADIRQVHLSAFPDVGEADLVDDLRGNGDAILSLVAVDSDVIGHVMFSRMQAPFKALGLAPVAVVAERRRQGVAASLIETGLKMAKASGWEGVFVLGSLDYYPRFGFDAGLAEGFECPYSGPYLMAVALQDSELPQTVGQVSYASAFDKLG